MAEFPCLPFYTDSYLADTRHLTAAQHGAYLLLLMTAWRTHDCSLPNDDEFLARCAAMDMRAWKANKETILAFFKVNPETQKLYQSRLVDERKFADDRREQSIRAGKASALKRKGRHSTDVETPVQPKVNHPYPLNPLTPKEIECAPEEIKKAFDDWNEIARSCGLPEARELNKTRKQKIRDRIASGKWPECLQIIRESKFLQGEKGFRATLDWILEPSHFTKIVEGNYSEKAENAPQQPIEITTPPEILKLLAKRKDVFTPAIIHHWIDPCTIEMNGETTIRAPNKFHSDWLKSHYLEPLGDCFDKLKIEERNAA